MLPERQTRRQVSGWLVRFTFFTFTLSSSFFTGCADGAQQVAQPSDQHRTVISENEPPQVAEPNDQLGERTNKLQQAVLQAEQSGEEVAAIHDIPLGSAGLNERVFDADIIARVRLIGTQAAAERLSTDENGSAVYRGVVEFVFEVLEYLKGTGGDGLHVGVNVERKPEVIRDIMDRQARGEFIEWHAVSWENPYTTMEQALEAAKQLEQERNTRWDDREAIILAREVPVPGSSDGSKRYSLGAIFDYALDSTYRVWLPAASSGEVGVKNAAAGVASEDGLFLLEVPNDAAPRDASGTTSVSPSTTSVSEIKALMVKLEQWRKEGEGVEGHLECIRYSFGEERSINGYKERGENLPSPRTDFHLDSGLPVETVVEDGYLVDGRARLEGKDKALFSFDNGTFRTMRPLPTGKYLVHPNLQAPWFIPCDYYPEEYKTMTSWFVDVSAPEGTLHEAFFDPVEVGAAVGADASSGVLEPASFEVEGVGATSIVRIAWESASAGTGEAGRVRMEFSPSGPPLVGHHVDFIALDGSVVLRLSVDDAAHAVEGDGTTLTWGVCKQPWESGDKLMLRISESGPELSGVTNDAECPSSGQ